MLKRILSLILVLTMLAGYMPVRAHAQEPDVTEEPAVTEETSVPIQQPTEPATEPTQPAVPEETSVPTQQPTEPATEPTQPAVPEETAAPTEAVEELQFVEYTYTSEADAAPQELFAAYAANLFYPNSFSTFGVAAGQRLTGDEKILYDALVPEIRKIACGQRASATISVGRAVPGYPVDVQATFTTEGFSDAQLGRVVDALLADLPYEFYWYDKVIGCAASYIPGNPLVQMIMKFTVANDYNGGSQFTANTAKTGVAAKSAANAQIILNSYASASDYEKLTGYRDVICALVQYDDDAALGGYFSTDIDPWQLISVFDGDSTTNVVCEGYSKAFQYLCDLSSFRGDVTCYSVTGNMISPGSSGPHMWNIVSIEGSNYLTDVTNSDTGTAGYDGSLFLAGASGSIARGYVVGDITFVYDNDMLSLWGSGISSILSLSSEKFTAPTGGGADENLIASGECGDNLTWKLDAEGTLTISGTGPMYNYAYSFEGASGATNPWGNYTKQIKKGVVADGVTSIGRYAFCGCSSMTSVEISDSVTSIDTNAFEYCYDLAELKIGNGVTSIGARAFAYCQNLTSLEIPDSVIGIGDYAFAYCYALTDLTIGDGVTEIGDWAFHECKNLTKVVIPDRVTSIGASAFENCWAMEVLVIGNGVITIGDNAFSNSEKLTSLEIPDSVTSIGSCAFTNCNSVTELRIGNGVTSIGECAFGGCFDLKHIEIPDCVATIGAYAFADCSGLKTLTIGSGVTGIGEYAFGFCWDLSTITFKGNAPRIGTEAFCEVTATVYYPANNATWTANVKGNYGGIMKWTAEGGMDESIVTSGTCGKNLVWTLDVNGTLTISGSGKTDDYTYSHAAASTPNYPWANYAKSIKKVVIADGVTGIGGYAFASCSSLTSVVLPDTLTSIGYGAFRSCSILAGVELPGSLTNIGMGAFGHCVGLKSIKIPDSITSISDGVFTGCTGLMRIELPDGLTSIGKTVFLGCSSLTNITIPNSVTSVGDQAFDGCSSLTSIVIPDKVTSIADWMFFDCSSLRSITFPDGLTSIGERAFDGCSSLTSIEIPDRVTSIGNYAFVDCIGLKHIELPDGLTGIGDMTFGYCSGLTSIVIPDSVTSIGVQAFESCNSLSRIVIPAGVSSISADAFWSCVGLNEIVFEGNAPEIAEEAFEDVFATVYYPANNPSWTADKRVDYGGGLTWVAYAPEIASGTCGDNLIWKLDAEGTLTISGTGPMDNYADIKLLPPWSSYYNKIKSVNIQNGVTTIGRYAFKNCSSLTSVSIPDSVTVICRDAFSGSGLISVVIPDSVIDVETQAFRECRKLTSATIGDGVTTISSCVFYGCTNLKSVTISDNVTVIENHAFLGCENLQNLTLGSNVTAILDCAFFGCRSLSNLVIPDSVTTIGESAFNSCASFTSIEIPGSVTNISFGVFEFCTSLKEVVLKEGIEYIEDWAFWGCTKLESVVIPDSLKGFDKGAFLLKNGMKISLNNVYYAGTQADWESYDTEGLPVVKYIHYSCTDYQNHWIEEEKAATCKENGYSRTGCSCGFVKNEQSLSALGHSLSLWYITVEADCTETGLQIRECSRCDYFEEKELPAKGHSYKAVVTKPTCTEDGYTTHTCSACSDTYTSTPKSKLGHNMGKWTVSAVPTCTETGMQQRDCSRCDHFEEEELPAKGHTYKTEVTKPTCAEAGYTTHTCSTCGDTYTDMFMPAQGHNYESVVKDPTCTEAGYTTFTCANCGDIYIDSPVAALGHTEVVDEAVAPSCTEDGLTEGSYCAKCNEIFSVQQTIPALGHDFEVTVTDPTCTADGEKRSHCLRCGHIETKVFPALGHKEVIDAAVAPTCTETGLTEGKHCDRCGEVLVVQEVIPATGHTYTVQGELVRCDACDFELRARIDQEYVSLAMNPYEYRTAQLKLLCSDEDLAQLVQWDIDGAAIVTVDANGIVTAQNAGSTYVVATVKVDEHTTISSRCRIDVTEFVQPAGVQLGSSKVNLELYKDDFATFEILLDLPQNRPENAAMISNSAANAGAKKSNIIDSVRFEKYSDLFELVMLDDRTVQIVPTQKALDTGKTVKSSYTDTVIVTIQGTEYPITEKLTLNIKKTMPKLKATVAAFNSFYEGQTQEIVITGDDVTGIRANDTKVTAIPAWLTLENGILKLNGATPKSSDKAYLWIDVDDWRVPTELTLNVKHSYKAPTLKLPATSVSLNSLNGDKKEIVVTSSFADYVPDELDITSNAGDALTVEKEGNHFTVSTNDKTVHNKTYKITIATSNPKIKAITLTVKTVGKAPTMNSLKLKGTLDVTFPANKLTIGVTMKDYADAFTPILIIKDSKGNDVTEQFTTNWNGAEFEVTPNGAVKGTYNVSVTALGLEKTAKLTVKETLPKIKLSATKVTLNKNLNHSVEIDITSATKGYELTSRVYVEAPAQVKAVPENGKLTVSLNKNAEYGKTYKITVSAYKGAPAVSLSIAVPKKDKSDVSATIKATGFIDVIREDSAITITPTFVNAYTSDMESMELRFYKRNGKVWEDVTEAKYFHAENVDGKFIVTAEENLTSADKYQAELVYKVGGKELKSKQIALTLKMGTAKVTVKSSDTTMFAKDRNDRALVWFEATDLTLNDVAKIEIKDAKYRDVFTIIDYEDGTFGLAFKDGKIHKEIEKLIAKKTSASITLNLNIFIDGNTTTKANTTQKVMLTIVK